jgi:hypothetical protein
MKSQIGNPQQRSGTQNIRRDACARRPDAVGPHRFLCVVAAGFDRSCCPRYNLHCPSPASSLRLSPCPSLSRRRAFPRPSADVCGLFPHAARECRGMHGASVRAPRAAMHAGASGCAGWMEHKLARRATRQHVLARDVCISALVCARQRLHAASAVQSQ